MKRYINASYDYNYIFKRVIKYFESIVKDAGCWHFSYNDYVVEPDWAGGGIRITLQWDGGNISEAEVSDKLESYFGSGIYCSTAWGNWDHQIMVHVADYRCR
jgi:hypothetical protein